MRRRNCWIKLNSKKNITFIQTYNCERLTDKTWNERVEMDPLLFHSRKMKYTKKTVNFYGDKDLFATNS